MTDKIADLIFLTDYMRMLKTLHYRFSDLVNTKLAETGLTRAQCETLLWLFCHGSEQTDTEILLQAFGVSRATMSQILTELSKKGFIEYDNLPNSKRSKGIALTDKANCLCSRFADNVRDINGAVFSGISLADYKTSNDVLNKLIDNIKFLEVNNECGNY